MASFTNFSDTLPNPNNPIAYDGSSNSDNQGYAEGPGYRQVSVRSQFRTARDKTNTGVLVTRNKAYQNFTVDITYNPLTEAEFNSIYGFLMEKQGQLKTFFVPLPQHDDPQDSTLASHSPEPAFTVKSPGYSAGKTKITIEDTTNYNSADNGQLRPGDLITFTDSSDSNHLKAYQITRVETNADYTGTQPETDELRISFVPPLQKDISSGATVNYKVPKMKVTLNSDEINYSLATNNLYNFSMKLEEVR